jgi:predicted LPLAT superfamily acyltransferase
MTAPTAAPRADWAHTPERSSMFTLRFMTWFSLHLGRTAARGVLLGIAAYFLLFAPASRRASSESLQRVFGQLPTGGNCTGISSRLLQPSMTAFSCSTVVSTF